MERWQYSGACKGPERVFGEMKCAQLPRVFKVTMETLRKKNYKEEEFRGVD